MTDWKAKLAGKFIVVDGPDGAGKSTQIGLLADYLRLADVDVRQARDPGGTVIGDKIRAILLDRAHDKMDVRCELMLYMASRAQLAAQVIRPALAAGQCVLCDRYVSSTIAYQGAGGADAAAIRAVADAAVGELRPDLTIIIDLPAENGLGRLSGARDHDRMESKDVEFHRRVRQSFLQQAAEDQRRFVVVDGMGGVEQVQQRLRQAMENWCD